MFPLNWDPCSITLALLLRIFILFAWVFLFSKESQGSLLICIVQFSRCCFAFRSLAEHFYYITFRRFCQVLFSSFFKIFFCDLRCSFADQLLYYITFSSVCQVLFSSFLKNFFLKWSVTRLPCNFYIISLIVRFVKYFFRLFLKISANLTFRSPKTFPFFAAVLALSSDSFIIIPPFFDIVKQKIRCWNPHFLFKTDNPMGKKNAQPPQTVHLAF